MQNNMTLLDAAKLLKEQSIKTLNIVIDGLEQSKIRLELSRPNILKNIYGIEGEIIDIAFYNSGLTD